MTRVVAGELRGRRLAGVPANASIRPTTDRTKTILFDILGPLAGVDSVLDLFAGTGALGIEALSRGARRATFVEHSALALKVLRDNIRALGLEERATVVEGDALAFADRAAARGTRWPLVIADPPYGDPAVDEVVGRVAAVVAPRGRLVLEHPAEHPAPERVHELELKRRRPVGRTVLAIYTRSRTTLENQEG